MQIQGSLPYQSPSIQHFGSTKYQTIASQLMGLDNQNIKVFEENKQQVKWIIFDRFILILKSKNTLYSLVLYVIYFIQMNQSSLNIVIMSLIIAINIIIFLTTFLIISQLKINQKKYKKIIINSIFIFSNCLFIMFLYLITIIGQDTSIKFLIIFLFLENPIHDKLRYQRIFYLIAASAFILIQDLNFMNITLTIVIIFDFWLTFLVQKKVKLVQQRFKQQLESLSKVGYFLYSPRIQKIIYQNEIIDDIQGGTNAGDNKKKLYFQKNQYKIVNNGSKIKQESKNKEKSALKDIVFLQKYENQENTKDQEKLLKRSFTFQEIITQYLNGDFNDFKNPDNQVLELILAKNSNSQSISMKKKKNIQHLLIKLKSLSVNDQEFIIFIVQDETSTFERYFQDDLIEYKSKMVLSFSHELRTPQNSSLNFLQAGTSDLSLPPHLNKEYFLPAINSIKFYEYIIDDIVDFSLFFNNNLNYKSEEFLLSNVFDEINDLFAINYEMKHIGLSLEVKGYIPKYFSTDYQKLMQILINILQNCLKFMMKKGKVIIYINSFDEGQSLTFEIQDNGLGIEKEKLIEIQQFLENFRENKQQASSQVKWQGIGLAISQIFLLKMAPKNRQVLEINSLGPNQGTHFKFHVRNNKRIRNGFSNNHIKGSSLCSKPDNNLETRSLRQIQNPNLLHENLIIIFVHFSEENISIFDQQEESFINNQMNLLSQNQCHFILPDQFQESNNQQKQKRNSKTCQTLKYIEFKEQQEKYGFEDNENIEVLLSANQNQCKCKKALSVDDEVFNQQSLKVIFKQMDYTLLVAFNGPECIEMIKKQQKCSEQCKIFEFILMDYEMPIWNGCQTTKMLKEMMKENQIPNIPIFGLTAYTQKSFIDNCIDSGMEEVFKKPFNVKKFKIELKKLKKFQ